MRTSRDRTDERAVRSGTCLQYLYFLVPSMDSVVRNLSQHANDRECWLCLPASRSITNRVHVVHVKLTATDCDALSGRLIWLMPHHDRFGNYSGLL